MTETAPATSFRAFLETQPPAVIQAVIAARPEASARFLAYLDERGVRHAGRISGATLAAVAGVSSRTWRRWVSGAEVMPTGARRVIVAAAFGC